MRSNDRARIAVFTAWLALALAVRAGEFTGPFPSWADVKASFGAVGDGRADDTAAIQKALESVRSQSSPARVLYFPVGTYRITDTLRLDRISHAEPLGMSLVGEDPGKTILRWDGPPGRSMLLHDGWYASVSRLTFDGAGRARTAIQHGPSFATANEYADVVVRDVEFGIEAGQKAGIAETAVLRCRFYRCSKAAISIQSFNSLDWYIWDGWVEACGIGVCNEFGAGNFHVYRSTFLRSREADLTIRHTGFFSFQGNTSVGSRRFFHAKRALNWATNETWGSQATLQDNRIFDPTDPTPIVIENNGPNLLLDNRIRASGSGPLVLNTPPAEQADLIAIGNTWTVSNALRVRGRLTDLDNAVMPASALADAKPAPAPFMERRDRPVIEVPAGADAAAIQAALDRAAAQKGRRPVVHLPKGNYAIGRTLVIPAGCDLQLAGDGPENATQLRGAGADPVIRVRGPTAVAFRNLLVNAGPDAEAIRIESCDQPGSRIYGEQLNANGYEYGIRVEGLRQADVELRDVGHNGLQVVGPGKAGGPWVKVFAGASSRHRHHKAGLHLYDVQAGGRLFVRDIWYEGEAWSLMRLAGSGEFAYHGGFVAPYAGFEPERFADVAWEADLRRTVAPLQFEGFRGRLAFTLVSANGAELRVVPPSPDLQLYLLGFLTNRKLALGEEAVKGRVAAGHVKAFRKEPTGLDSVEGAGSPDPAFIRDMLRPLRELKPRDPEPLTPDATDVRFHRVWASGRNGVRVQGGPGENERPRE